MQPDVFRLLVCPGCRDGELCGLDAAMIDGHVVCSLCAAVYPVRGGIPVLLPRGFDASHVHDEIDHAHGAQDAHKQQQSAYFDREVAAEFEITRPHGTPPAYRWLLGEKFRRSIAALPALDGAVVADVCCGSGMEAEMLERAGARVIAFDISEGCALRAKERATRLGLEYAVVVADVEHLPLRDGGADIAYVHDGLHHLEHPTHGLREMARVARHAVSINEPADAFATQIAVKLGLSIDVEGAGNRVARLRPADVTRELRRQGFADVQAERYLMYYKHDPGSVMRAASAPIAQPLYRRGVALTNAAIGRWGNKLQVTAIRRAA